MTNYRAKKPVGTPTTTDTKPSGKPAGGVPTGNPGTRGDTTTTVRK